LESYYQYITNIERSIDTSSNMYPLPIPATRDWSGGYCFLTAFLVIVFFFVGVAFFAGFLALVAFAFAGLLAAAFLVAVVLVFLVALVAVFLAVALALVVVF
jgi:hypothetical protein